ncbi:MAG: ABC transporter ATP-binding protein [Thermodesulfobacteriota bacterium]
MNETPETLLKIEDLRLSFKKDTGLARVLDGVCLEIRRSGILGLIGETGCGKSVTGDAVLGLIPRPPGIMEAGRVWFKGRDLLRLPEKEMRAVRGREIAMILQDPFTALNPVYTVGRQIVETITLHQDLRGSAARRQASTIMSAVGIPEPDQRMNHYPHQFSGGLRQRAAIAMALSCQPDLLIADEPTTALDVTVQAQILELLSQLNRNLGTAILLISHDLGVISSLCHRVAIMYSGTVVENAGLEDFFEAPLHPYSQALLGAIPRLATRRDELAVIKGQIPDLVDPPLGCRFHPRCSQVAERCRREKPVLKSAAADHQVACFKVTG